MSALTVPRCPSPRPRYARFADFELDLLTQELSRNGVRIQLQPKAFQVLEALLEREGDIVTRVELQRRLWPTGVHVEFETSLNTAVNRLRLALRDTAERPKFVETLPRRGYRFLVPVQWIQAEEALPRVLKPRGAKVRARGLRRFLLLAGLFVLFAAVALIVWTATKRALPVRPGPIGMSAWHRDGRKESGGSSSFPRFVSAPRPATG